MTTNVIDDPWIVLICLVYAGAAAVLQMHRVVPPRDWLLQRLDLLTARIAAEGWRVGKQSQPDLESTKKELGKHWSLVSTSKVQAGWRQVHGLEDDHTLELLPADVVDEQLRSARATLSTASDSEAKALVQRIDAVEKDKADLDAKRALLQRVMIYRHSKSDTSYEDLAALLAKAVWLSVLTLAIVAGLGVLFDRETYFLFGAAGALVSRLTRVLRRMPKASDYGAAWSTLILSPPAGALAGWLGVMVAAVLAGDPFNVLADVFAGPWDNTLSLLGFFVAFVSGFSERWFNRLVGTAETQLAGALPRENEKE